MSPSSDFQTAPPILYKYRRFDSRGRHLRLISHGELWFGSAKNFNDPFDTSFRFNFDGLHNEIAEQWARVAVKRHEPHLLPEELEQRAMRRIAEIRNNPNEVEKMHAFTVESNYRAWGICSLCTSRDNLLLWAHYSEDHKGFCVGLSTDILDSISKHLIKVGTILDLQKVTYSSNAPNPNFFEKMLNIEDSGYIMEFIATKSPDWSYEHEFRLVLWDKVNFSLLVPPTAIKEVILGCRISDQNREALLQACRRHVPQAALFQAKKEDTKFSLALEPVT